MTGFDKCPSPSARRRWPRCRSVAAVLALSLLASALPRPAAPVFAADSGVLAKIEAEGVMRAGTRASAPPFARTLASGEFEGFSVDLLEEIRADVEKRVGRSVTLELHEVTPSDRLERVAAGELDIVCGITTPTWDREALVDFSVPFFRDGTRILIYRERAAGGVDLGRTTIGVVEGTTTVTIVSDALPTANLRLYPTMTEAMAGLEAGEVDGVANIGITLLGLAARAEPRRSVVLLPRTYALAMETLACVLPQDDSPWRDVVNRVIVDIFSRVEDSNSRYDEIYERWFGRNSEIFYPLDRDNRAYLSTVSIWAR
jgi:polar amino acid transport system substrate-binding protein